MQPNELRAAIEAILFAAGEPVQIQELTEAFPDEKSESLLEQLQAIQTWFEENIAGFRVEHAAGGYRLATRPEQDPYLRKFFARKNEGRLSMAALETLAIIAYRQPITAPEISDIRGVNSSGVLRTLMERRMIRIAGRKNVVGSPFLYRTTREFLTHFGLNDIRDLPRLEEFGDLLGENISEELIAGIGADAMPTVPGPDEELEPEPGSEGSLLVPAGDESLASHGDILQPEGAGRVELSDTVEPPTTDESEVETGDEEYASPVTAPEQSSEHASDDTARDESGGETVEFETDRSE